MATNGISLNTREDKKNDRKSLIIGVLAGIGIAALVAGAFMLGGRGNGRDAAASTSVGRATGESAVDDSEDASSSNGGQQSGGESNGGNADEPTIAPEEPAEEPTDEPTATPTNTPEPGDPCPFCPEDVDDLAPLPTATPSDPCQFCPDLVDDLQVEPTPVIFCPLCLDPQLELGELPELAFKETSVKVCAGFVSIDAEITGHAEIWVEYEKMGDAIESPHQYGGSFSAPETGDWVWFGSWGWVYPYDFTFHAENAEGEHIEKYVLADYVC